MSVQVRRRREAAAFLQSFVGAQGELLVDTTNNRVQVHDGTTAGGWPAARLADLPSSTAPLGLAQGGTGVSAGTAQALAGALGLIGRTTVADAPYAALATDRLVAFTALSAARTVTLPAATAYPAGVTLTIVDESGACSAANTITLAAAGGDKVNGAASVAIATAFGYLALESSGAGRWTVIDAVASGGATQAPATTLRGNPTGSAANVQDASLSTHLDAAFGATVGQIVVRGASGWATLAPGSSGQVLTANGTGAVPTFKAPAATGAAALPTVTRLLSGSGTYSVPAGATWLRIRMVGGGGGGGGGGGTGAAGGATGTAGGATTFSGFVANGGNGGQMNNAGGSGGSVTVPTTGVTVLAANAGGQGGVFNQSAQSTTPANMAGGNGGVAALGGNGAGSLNSNGGAGAANTGGGGGGGSSDALTNTYNNSGSGGGSGGFIEAIIPTPAASYAYAIGTGGAGGSAGSSGGRPGGTGGSGVVIVEEHYGS